MNLEGELEDCFLDACESLKIYHLSRLESERTARLSQEQIARDREKERRKKANDAYNQLVGYDPRIKIFPSYIEPFAVHYNSDGSVQLNHPFWVATQLSKVTK